MSRVGKQPITVPDGVVVKLAGREVSVKGPKGQLTSPAVTEKGRKILLKELKPL